MRTCEIDYHGGPEHNTTGHHWCETHELPAWHSAGDTGPVCEVSARYSGCKCCFENHDKLYMSGRAAFYAFILGEIAGKGDDITKAIVADVMKELKEKSKNGYF